MGEKEVAPPADAKKVQKLLPAQSSLRPFPSTHTHILTHTQDAQGLPQLVTWPERHQCIWVLVWLLPMLVETPPFQA